MNIKIEKKDLVALITKAGRGAAHNSAIPQLQVLYMEAANGKLVARATNMEFGIKTSTSELQFDEEGKVLVNAKYFENFVKSLPAGVISLEVKDNKLQVKYARSKANLNLLEGSDYPDWPECQKEVITIPGNLLRKGISAVLPAVAKNHFRMVFTGVLMDIKADKTIWVGSDTHRLAIIETEGGGNPQQLIIPLKTAEELLRVVDDEDVVVYTSGNNLLFKTGETEIFSRIINGQYPDVNAVISKDFVSECSVNTETFRQSIARILTLPPSEGKIQSAHLTLNGALEVSAVSDAVGEIKDIIEIKKTGQDLEIYFNANYLIDALKGMPEQTKISFAGTCSPALFAGDDGFRLVLVPLIR